MQQKYFKSILKKLDQKKCVKLLNSALVGGGRVCLYLSLYRVHTYFYVFTSYLSNWGWTRLQFILNWKVSLLIYENFFAIIVYNIKLLVVVMYACSKQLRFIWQHFAWGLELRERIFIVFIFELRILMQSNYKKEKNIINFVYLPWARFKTIIFIFINVRFTLQVISTLLSSGCRTRFRILPFSGRRRRVSRIVATYWVVFLLIYFIKRGRIVEIRLSWILQYRFQSITIRIFRNLKVYSAYFVDVKHVRKLYLKTRIVCSIRIYSLCGYQLLFRQKFSEKLAAAPVPKEGVDLLTEIVLKWDAEQEIYYWISPLNVRHDSNRYLLRLVKLYVILRYIVVAYIKPIVILGISRERHRWVLYRSLSVLVLRLIRFRPIHRLAQIVFPKISKVTTGWVISVIIFLTRLLQYFFIRWLWVIVLIVLSGGLAVQSGIISGSVSTFMDETTKYINSMNFKKISRLIITFRVSKFFAFIYFVSRRCIQLVYEAKYVLIHPGKLLYELYIIERLERIVFFLYKIDTYLIRFNNYVFLDTGKVAVQVCVVIRVLSLIIGMIRLRWDRILYSYNTMQIVKVFKVFYLLPKSMAAHQYLNFKISRNLRIVKFRRFGLLVMIVRLTILSCICVISYLTVNFTLLQILSDNVRWGLRVFNLVIYYIRVYVFWFIGIRLSILYKIREFTWKHFWVIQAYFVIEDSQISLFSRPYFVNTITQDLLFWFGILCLFNSVRRYKFFKTEYLILNEYLKFDPLKIKLSESQIRQYEFYLEELPKGGDSLLIEKIYVLISNFKGYLSIIYVCQIVCLVLFLLKCFWFAGYLSLYVFIMSIPVTIILKLICFRSMGLYIHFRTDVEVRDLNKIKSESKVRYYIMVCSYHIVKIFSFRILVVFRIYICQFFPVEFFHNYISINGSRIYR